MVSADADFWTLLAESRAQGPLIILVRRSANRRALHLASLTEANLAELADDLEVGSVVVFDSDRIRVRRPPLI